MYILAKLPSTWGRDHENQVSMMREIGRYILLCRTTRVLVLHTYLQSSSFFKNKDHHLKNDQSSERDRGSNFVRKTSLFTCSELYF